MSYILKITTRHDHSKGEALGSWVFKTYNEACKKMVEELEKLNRQIMATDLTKLTGYTIILDEWVTRNTYNNVACIDYDLAL